MIIALLIFSESLFVMKKSLKNAASQSIVIDNEMVIINSSEIVIIDCGKKNLLFDQSQMLIKNGCSSSSSSLVRCAGST